MSALFYRGSMKRN